MLLFRSIKYIHSNLNLNKALNFLFLKQINKFENSYQSPLNVNSATKATPSKTNNIDVSIIDDELKISLLKQFEEEDESVTSPKSIVKAAELILDEQDAATSTDELNLEENQKYINVLKTYFGHSSFRSPQLSIIKKTIEEKRDQLVVMATGRGKSLCYQFPALFHQTGLTVVISPLISLMEDQVMSLALLNVQACLLGTAQKSNDSTEQDLKDGKYKVLFITPEHLETAPDLLKSLNEILGINLLAIDECHCVR